MSDKDSHLMHVAFDMGEDITQSRAAYEAWIRSARARARRERIFKRVLWGMGIVGAALMILGLLVAVNSATAAPMKEPIQRPKIEEPEANPRSGERVSVMKERCERIGGHWLEEDGGEQMPNHKIIGCLFAVPKGAK